MLASRFFSCLIQSALLFSYGRYFPTAIKEVSVDSGFHGLPGFAGLEALPWNSYFSLGRLILTLLLSSIFLEASLRFGSLGRLRITRDDKNPLMFGAFLVFYTAPPLLLTGFRIWPAWGFWGLAGIAASIISLALYGLEMFPLGSREMAGIYHNSERRLKQEAARVRALAAVLGHEQMIAQMTLTIAVALSVSVGIGLLSGGIHLFQDRSTFLHVMVLWIPPMAALSLGYIYYFLMQNTKASQLSEILHQMLFLPPGSPLWGHPQGTQPYPHGFGPLVGVGRALTRTILSAGRGSARVLGSVMRSLTHRASNMRLGRYLRSVLRKPVVVGALTLLTGFVAYSTASLIRGTFFWNSKVSFPVLKIVTITVGDSVFMPVICALIMWFLNRSECDLSVARQGGLGTAAASTAIRLTPWYTNRAVIPVLFVIGSLPHVLLHYIWINDPYTGFMDEVVGKLTPAGWIHLLFSMFATCYILYGIWKGILLLSVAGRASRIGPDTAKTLRIFTTFVLLLCVFQSLEIIDFPIKTFLIQREPILRSLRREYQVLFSLIPLLVFFPIVNSRVHRLTARLTREEAEPNDRLPTAGASPHDA